MYNNDNNTFLYDDKQLFFMYNDENILFFWALMIINYFVLYLKIFLLCTY